MESDTSFYLALSTLSSIVGMVLMYIYKSKCSSVDICYGLINIQRDTITEGQLDETKASDEEKAEEKKPTI